MKELLDSLVYYNILGELLLWGAFVLVVCLVIYYKMNETKKRTQIAMAAIEKNSAIDVKQLMKQLSPKRKSPKERLLQKLLRGSICSLLGLVLIIYAMVEGYTGGQYSEGMETFSLWGVALLVVGIAFLVNYVVGKKVLRKEIEAEEKEFCNND